MRSGFMSLLDQLPSNRFACSHDLPITDGIGFERIQDLIPLRLQASPPKFLGHQALLVSWQFAHQIQQFAKAWLVSRVFDGSHFRVVLHKVNL